LGRYRNDAVVQACEISVPYCLRIALALFEAKGFVGFEAGEAGFLGEEVADEGKALALQFKE
jgi:hypothetical protein